MKNIFSNKIVLITGGTGSLGKALTSEILKHNPKSIRIFSRDESKQQDMREILNNNRLRFLIGDVRDKQRLSRAVENVDIIIHTAALKQIDIGEYNPFECIQTNIIGSQNVIDVALDEEVEICLGISTDKAVSPLNLYGSTKLAMEKLFIAANLFKGTRKTKFSCVRYGNVFGSRGSVVPQFLKQIQNNNEIQVTNPDMTRFNISMEYALDLIFTAIEMSKGSEVFIPKLEAYSLSNLINAFQRVSTRKFKVKKIPIRNGEKTHELLLNKFEVPYTIESNNVYILLPPQLPKNEIKKKYPLSKSLTFPVYSSEFVKTISAQNLEKMIKNFMST
jgi:UDP-N-acetylglucosamine 4,6-dehydratase/5-epimerase